MSVIDINTADRYRWGAGSRGWHLLQGADLSVIQETVPPGDRERLHVHRHARQFFYVLDGEAVLQVGDVVHVLRTGQGLEVAPGLPHQFRNESGAAVTFLVISAPRAHGDRVDL